MGARFQGKENPMKFHVMDSKGHSTLEFDKTDPASVKEAMEKFEELVGEQKHTAAVRNAGEADYKLTRSFDPTADETVFVPAMQGG
jgi:hypothetical protein